MIQTSRHRIAKILMGGSMILLLCFSYFWLQQNHQNIRADLERETNNVFLSAFQDARDSISIAIFPNLKNLIDTVEGENELQVMTVVSGKEEVVWDSEGPQVEMKLKKRVLPEDHNGLPHDSLNIVISTHSSSAIDFEEDSLFSFSHLQVEENFMELAKGVQRAIAIIDGSSLNGDTTKSLPLIKEVLEKHIQNLPTQESYVLLQPGKDDYPENVLLSKIQKDIWTKESFQLGLLSYRSALLKRLWPQFLFIFILLSFVLAAFVMIYRSWLEQLRLSKIKDDFVSNITHELKTPITTVGVALEALNNFDGLKDPIKTKEYLDISKHELNRLSLLVDKILKMSVFENKEPALKLESVDLKEVVEKVLGSLKLLFEKHQAQIQWNSNDGQYIIQADRIHLTNVIYNLLDNAIKYSSENPEINIDLNTNGAVINLKIADKGIGISNSYQNKIFDKFFRVPSENKHNVKGHGLGLSYVQSIIKKHNGQISVESKEGEGSCFTINLPVA